MGSPRRALNILGVVFLVGVAGWCAWYFLVPRFGPITRYEKTLSVDEGTYQFIEVPMNAMAPVHVDVRVVGGPRIGVFFMDMVSFGEWKKANSKLLGGQFHLIQQLSSDGTQSFHGFAVMKPGQYVLVLQNAPHPPIHISNDVATVECRIRTD
jgi:hypothetical protein